ncbi:MAG: flavin monoamine oxidase family protein [Vicinamibacterales bacterium]
MLTRRSFIERVAAAGGASLAYDTMFGLGLMAAPRPAPFDLQGSGQGTRVAIIGAGIAGLTVAYELGKLGYDCHILEARSRPGGRAHTVRRGTVSEEDGPRQVCDYDEGLYFNPGPMRIAYHHDTTLGYCRELGVPVEVFAVSADSTYLFMTKAAEMAGRRVRLREVRTDIDGYVSELLSKAVSAHALDEALTKDDSERLLEYLKSVGHLDTKGKYTGNPDYRGPADPHAHYGEDTPGAPLSLTELLSARLGYYVDLSYEYQPTMMQVVGGMDRLPRALADRLQGRITYEAPARRIRQTESGVTVTYDGPGGTPKSLDADYLVCAMPLPLLAEVDSDLPEDFKKLVASVPYAAAGKMGMQFKRRFWEEDDQIFGGATKTDLQISQIVYPSTGYLGKKGTLLGYYLMGNTGRPVGNMAPEDRIKLALDQGRQIHPQYDQEFETAFSVAWHRVTWNKGSWSSTPADTKKALNVPQGRVYLAGDHLNLNAWMQGAFESGRHVATAIHERASSDRRIVA